MNDKAKDKFINKLVIENSRLKRDLRAACAKQTKLCGTCVRIERHDCYTLYRCPIFGVVDPESDRCPAHKPRENA